MGSAPCCRPVADWLPRLEILSLDLGLLLSARKCGLSDRGWLKCPWGMPQALKLLARPGPCSIILLFAAGSPGCLSSPMQMRGTL